MNDDPVERVDQAATQIGQGIQALLIRLRLIVIGMAAVIALMLLAVAGLLAITFDTNRTVNERNDELKATIEDQDIVIDQAVAGFHNWCEYIKSIAGQCPTIELNPALGRPAPPPED